MTSPFDFVKEIHHGKNDLIADDPELEKEYKAFIVNRALSFGHDTALYANEMNVNNHLDPALQFSFLLNTIRPKKRFNKWLKRENDEHLSHVQEYYNCSYAKARDYVKVLSDAQLKMIRDRLDKGGTK